MPLAFVPFHSKIRHLTLIIVAVLSCVIQISSVCTKTHEVSVLRNEIHLQTNLSTSSQLPSTLRLFWHKLINDSTIVPAFAIGVSSKQSFDLSSYESFYGFNLWPIHALKFIGLQSLCYPLSLILLVIVLALVALLFHLNFKQYRNQQL
jgi:hypothetical protein